MSLFKYEVFLEVARQCSLSKAAAALNQTVPGVSYTISKLEDEFGIPLLIRNHSRIELTEDARRLLPHMTAVLNVDKRLGREVEAIKTRNAGRVNVGSITAVARRWMPQLMRAFRDEHPDIEVNFLINGYENLFNMLLLTTIDLAVMVDPRNGNAGFIPFKRDRLYALFPADDTYQFVMDQKQVTVDELRAYPLIIPDWGKDPGVESFMGEEITASARYFINDAETIIGMVRNHFGVGIISEVFLEGYPEDVIAAPIQDGPSRILGIVTNANLRLTAGAELFQRFMLGWLAEHRISDIRDM